MPGDSAPIGQLDDEADRVASRTLLARGKRVLRVVTGKERRERAESLERLRLSHAALDIERARYSNKFASSNTRASFVIAASGIVLGYDGSKGDAHAVPVVLLLLAAGTAIYAIRPGKVREVNVESLRKRIRFEPLHKAEFFIYRAKVESLNSARKHLQPRERMLLFSSFVFLTGVLGIGLENAAADPAQSEQTAPLISPSPSVTISP